MFSHDEIEVMHIKEKYHIGEETLSRHCMRGYRMLICLVTGEVRFNYLVKVVSEAFPL